MQQVPRKGCALDQQQGIFQAEEVTTEPCHAQTGGAVQSMLSIHSNMTLDISIPEQINPTALVAHHHDPPHFLCVHPLHKTLFFMLQLAWLQQLCKKQEDLRQEVQWKH